MPTSNIISGLAAQAVIQGNKPTAMLTGITERRAWNDATKTRSETVESLALDVVSPATRFNKITVTVLVEGCSIGITDADLEAIAQAGGQYPHVRFEGLSVKLWTSRDSAEVKISATASKAYICDESGAAKK